MSDLQSSDDEFDELFSFSATNAAANKAPPHRSSSSPIDLDLSEKEEEPARTDPTAATSVHNGPTASSAQTSESGSSSYDKVSPTMMSSKDRPMNDNQDSTNKMDMEQEEENVSLDDFDLDAVNLNSVNDKQLEEEDDFHDMDADTRELLEFLDEPSKTVTEAKSSTALDILEKDLEDFDDDDSKDDDGDEGIMDFVKIEEERNSPKDNYNDVSLLRGKDGKNALAKSSPAVVAAAVNVSPTTTTKIESDSLAESNMEQETSFSLERNVHSAIATGTTEVDVEKVPKETMTTTSTATATTTTTPIMDQQSCTSPSLQMESYPNQLPSSPPPKLSKRETSTASNSNPYQMNSILASMDDDSSIESQNKINNDEKEDTTDQNDRDFSGNLMVHGAQVEEEKVVVFDTLSEAVRSKDSPQKTIRSLLFPHPTELATVEDGDRAYLWSKMICSRTLSDVEMSSLADSFVNWDESFDMRAFEEGDRCYGFMEDFVSHLLEEVDFLSKRIVGQYDSNGSEEVLSVDDDVVKRNLCSILLFYYQSNFIPDRQDHKGQDKNNELIETEGLDDSLVLEEDVTENVRMEFESDSNDQQEEEEEDVAVDEDKEEKVQPKEKRHAVEWNSLIGPVASTLLASGATTAAASVMLSRIIPTFMPLVPLTKQERFQAVKSLHMKLHHLICYHLPLLSLHLDRNIPGWYWPQSVVDVKDDLSDFEADNVTEKSRHLETQGVIPITWFASLLAGEGRNLTLDKSRLLALWDVLLSTHDQSLKFFLALSVLERNSEKLLMLKGQQLIDELMEVLFLKNAEDVESFAADPAGGKDKLGNGQEYVRMWINHARTLRQNTPVTVVEYLNKSEDDAVNYILNQRSKFAMEAVAARLEAEAEAHRRAMEEENAKRKEERLRRYYRDRLEKFYEKHCPEKIGSIDKILDIYKDRYQVLDKKLHAKYGKGFLPLISVFNPAVTSQTGKMISTVNQGIEIKKKNIIAARAEERAKLYAEQMEGTKQKSQVAIPVSASEIMPIVCGGKKIEKVTRMKRDTLKYYLVDSRPEASMKSQGAFPTAARLSPEDLMDPERLQQKIDMFEALRGTVHIVIMGEGFSAFPSLYGHPLDKNEQKLLENDESRTSMCALFFIKRGFPFISILDGGFAAAHAWLARELKDELCLSEVLIDYDVESSLFADLERSYQEQEEFKSAPARRKTMLAMQKLIDNSMIRLTTAEAQIEEFTDRFITARKEVKDKGSTKTSEDGSNTASNETFESTTEGIENEKKSESNSFKSTFAGLRSKVSQKNKDGVTKDQKAFDLSKISFGREKNDGKDIIGSDLRTSQRNFFKKQNKNEDDELERKIDESLAPPENQVEDGGKHKSNIFQRMKFVKNNNNASEKTNIKDAFAKIKFTKFNSTRPTIPVDEDDVDVLQQEESVLFDDDN